MKIEKVYHHHELWEDWKCGMYKRRTGWDDNIKISQSKKLLSSPDDLLQSMREVVKSWPFAAEENLTNIHCNRQAWLGQAACCLAHGASDWQTKEAWRSITDEQRNAANLVADVVTKEYEDERMLSHA